jgi:D-alanine-D-alanine ligase
MKVTVLCGGPSAERDISLISGQAVMDGLRQAGHDVTGSDVSATDLAGLDRPADVIFPALHGAFGESGELQQILEQRGLAFVGSGSKASRVGMDKVQSKRMWEHANLPTPPYEILTPAELSRSGGPAHVTAPCVVKPIDSGSSIDVYICKGWDDARRACERVVTKHGRALVEQYIAGVEITVGILEERALSPIRITTNREFFDYQAKYVGNDAQHHFELKLPEPLVKQIMEIAARAHSTLGCRDLSRVDLIVDDQRRPWLLEINTMPGFTPKSLLPEAAAHDGIPFAQLVDRLVCRAYKRARGTDQRRHVA